MPHLRLCQLTQSNGRECQGPVPADFPMDLCETHALMATAVILERGGATVRRLTSMYDPGYVRRIDNGKKPKEPLYVGSSPAVVYYLKHSNTVKIGTSRSLRKRLGQVGHERLLAVEPGHYSQEKLRHQQFAEYRLHGEWFSLNADIEDHIAHLVEMYGPPEAAYLAWEQAAIAV